MASNPFSRFRRARPTASSSPRPSPQPGEEAGGFLEPLSRAEDVYQTCLSALQSLPDDQVEATLNRLRVTLLATDANVEMQARRAWVQQQIDLVQSGILSQQLAFPSQIPPPGGPEYSTYGGMFPPPMASPNLPSGWSKNYGLYIGNGGPPPPGSSPVYLTPGSPVQVDGLWQAASNLNPVLTDDEPVVTMNDAPDPLARQERWNGPMPEDAPTDLSDRAERAP